MGQGQEGLRIAPERSGRHRHQQHQRQVSAKQTHDSRQCRPPPAPQHHRGAQHQGKGDALEDAGNAQCSQVEGGNGIEGQADEEDHHSPLHQRAQDGGAVLAFPSPAAQRERQGKARREEEEGEDQIREGAPVPLRVGQGRVDGAPGTWVVHQHHARDGEAPEGVERGEARGGTHACSRRPKAGSMRRKPVSTMEGSVAQHTQMKKFR